MNRQLEGKTDPKETKAMEDDAAALFEPSYDIYQPTIKSSNESDKLIDFDADWSCLESSKHSDLIEALFDKAETEKKTKEINTGIYSFILSLKRKKGTQLIIKRTNFVHYHALFIPQKSRVSSNKITEKI